MIPVQLFDPSFLGWLQREHLEIVLYLREENRVLKAQLRHRRLQLTDYDRRRLAAWQSIYRVVSHISADLVGKLIAGVM